MSDVKNEIVIAEGHLAFMEKETKKAHLRIDALHKAARIESDLCGRSAHAPMPAAPTGIAAGHPDGQAPPKAAPGPKVDAEPKHARQIEQAIGYLHMAVEDIEERATVLDDRLQAVVLPAPPDEWAGKPVDDYVVPLAGAINELTMRIAKVSNRLRGLGGNRLEL